MYVCVCVYIYIYTHIYKYANVPNLINKFKVRNSSGPTIQLKDLTCISILGWLCGVLPLAAFMKAGF